MFSEKKLVVVLFIMVFVTFVFAQADSSKLENTYLNNIPAVTTSVDHAPVPAGEITPKEIKPPIPAVQVR